MGLILLMELGHLWSLLQLLPPLVVHLAPSLLLPALILQKLQEFPKLLQVRYRVKELE